MGPKTIPEARTCRSFGLLMIILNVIGILLRVEPEHKAEAEYEQRPSSAPTRSWRGNALQKRFCLLWTI